MTQKVVNYTEVNTKKVGADVQTIGQEIVDGDTYLNNLRSEIDFGVDGEIPTVTIELKLVPTHNSLMSGGYEIPTTDE